jgi:hypothetical protein
LDVAADTPGELKRDPRAAAREARAEQYLKRDLEEAIGKRASAFAVYVGSKGVVNWVEAEVRLVLSRATGSGGRCLP